MCTKANFFIMQFCETVQSLNSFPLRELLLRKVASINRIQYINHDPSNALRSPFGLGTHAPPRMLLRHHQSLQLGPSHQSQPSSSSYLLSSGFGASNISPISSNVFPAVSTKKK